MKRSILLATVITLFTAGIAQGQLPHTPLEGTWRLVSQKLVYPDSTVDRGATLEPTIKVLNSTHFTFGRQLRNTDEVYAGGGRYTLDGSKYTEIIMFHSAPGLVGQAIEFTMRLEGDTWYHTGRISDFNIEEVWERVEPETNTASR